MNIGYIRVSTIEQHEDRQREALAKFDIDKWFVEKVSGKNIKDRPQLQELLNYMREGDAVYVLDFSRLARNTRDLLYIVDTMQEKNVKLVSIKENLDTDTPTGKLMLTMFAAIGEFERQNTLERQAEGIAIAKKKGVYKGRKRIKLTDFTDFGRYYQRYMDREISKAEFARRLGVSRPTLDRLLDEYREKSVV